MLTISRADEALGTAVCIPTFPVSVILKYVESLLWSSTLKAGTPDVPVCNIYNLALFVELPIKILPSDEILILSNIVDVPIGYV